MIKTIQQQYKKKEKMTIKKIKKLDLSQPGL